MRSRDSAQGRGRGPDRSGLALRQYLVASRGEVRAQTSLPPRPARLETAVRLEKVIEGDSVRRISPRPGRNWLYRGSQRHPRIPLDKQSVRFPRACCRSDASQCHCPLPRPHTRHSIVEWDHILASFTEYRIRHDERLGGRPRLVRCRQHAETIKWFKILDSSFPESGAFDEIDLSYLSQLPGALGFQSVQKMPTIQATLVHPRNARSWRHQSCHAR